MTKRTRENGNAEKRRYDNKKRRYDDKKRLQYQQKYILRSMQPLYK